ncbi:hypothetical protein GCM10010160_24090 [Acrocarpospora corrugata]
MRCANQVLPIAYNPQIISKPVQQSPEPPSRIGEEDVVVLLRNQPIVLGDTVDVSICVEEEFVGVPRRPNGVTFERWHGR